ncbi:hypothetical protein EB796_008438 [Bugula neritina]|uniref:Uncharacterized protein n=1 Tax=Bugula neritina TaxID=10212 RepID=A0A7J7K3Q9_BUGNE|nr:hypothetical protein EB796_008438 [Bugula neritina]
MAGAPSVHTLITFFRTSPVLSKYWSTSCITSTADVVICRAVTYCTLIIEKYQLHQLTHQVVWRRMATV